jgi:DNA-binding NtrC family response regulator
MAEKYKMPGLRLNEGARNLLISYKWKGNIRQLKNITEQIAIIEQDREITAEILSKYLPDNQVSNLPVLFSDVKKENEHISERELLYKVLFDMRKDITDLKHLVRDIIDKDGDISKAVNPSNARFVQDLHQPETDPFDELTMMEHPSIKKPDAIQHVEHHQPVDEYELPIQESEVLEESLSLQQKEIELIKRALKKHHGKRKTAAEELGISERTLYRKIKEYDIT